MATVPGRWRKSSYSDQNTCVETDSDLTAVRDSKQPEGPVLRADVRQLVLAVRAGLLR